MAKYTAFEYQTGRLIYESDDLNYLVADVWASEYINWCDTAKQRCKEAGSAIKKPKFYIENRVSPIWFKDARKVPCLCLAAGVFDLAHVAFVGSNLPAIMMAFDRKKQTLEEHDRAWWAPAEPKQMEYYA
jgi:hypothetical protein